MSTPARTRKKKGRLLQAIHKWVALVVALLVIVQAGTGIILANQDVLLPLFNPEARIQSQGPRASLDALIASASDAAPGARFERLIYNEDQSIAIIARVRMPPERTLHIVLLDPNTARVLSTGRAWDYPTQFSERIHVSLLSGAAGMLVLMIEGLALLFLAVSGLILWWPRAGRWSEALTVHWRAPWRRALRDLHLAPGAMLAIFFALSGLTGALIIGEPLVKPVVALVAPVIPERLPELTPAPEDATLSMSAQEALEALEARFPDGRLRQVRIIGPANRLTGVVMTAEDAINPRALHIAGIDRLNGEMIILTDAHALPAGEAALMWLLPTHDGEIYGPLRRPIMTLIGLGLLLASITGVSMWALKPRRRKGVT